MNATEYFVSPFLPILSFPLLTPASFNLLKPTGYLMRQQVQHKNVVHSAHTVFMRFVFISEETATFALCNIN
jgi:hypothetical protein